MGTIPLNKTILKVKRKVQLENILEEKVHRVPVPRLDDWRRQSVIYN